MFSFNVNNHTENSTILYTSLCCQCNYRINEIDSFLLKDNPIHWAGWQLLVEVEYDNFLIETSWRWLEQVLRIMVLVGISALIYTTRIIDCGVWMN